MKTFLNTSQRFFSERLLMRNYIKHKLYDKQEGYYGEQNTNPIGQLPNQLMFTQMRGSADYACELNNIYPKSTWVTYTEILRPYFGYAIGSYILQRHSEKKNGHKIKILDVGIGNGGAALSILDYMKKFSIKSYKDVEYFGLEPCKSLHLNAERNFKSKHPEMIKENRLHIINKTFEEYTNSISPPSDCYILAFNLMNSLGHDRVLIDKKFEKILQKEIDLTDVRNFAQFDSVLRNILKKIPDLIKQTEVDIKNEKMTLSNVNDEKIYKCLSYYLCPPKILFGENFVNLENQRKAKTEDIYLRLLRKLQSASIFSRGNYIWLPTDSLDFFSQVAKYKNHHLILSDFDYLPGRFLNCDYGGKGSPEVYSIRQDSNDALSHKSIFANGSNIKLPVNVYFPVDFDLAQRVYRLLCNKNSTINKFSYFMNNNAMGEWSETKSGFNPMIDTNKNVSFLLSLD